MISRRSLFRGLGAILAAPAVAKVARLIPPVEAARVRSVDYMTLADYSSRIMSVYPRFTPKPEWCDLFGDDDNVGSTLRIRLPSDYRVTPT